MSLGVISVTKGEAGPLAKRYVSNPDLDSLDVRILRPKCTWGDSNSVLFIDRDNLKPKDVNGTEQDRVIS